MVPAVSSLAKSQNEVGTRLGICFLFTGLGGLTGEYISRLDLTLHKSRTNVFRRNTYSRSFINSRLPMVEADSICWYMSGSIHFALCDLSNNSVASKEYTNHIGALIPSPFSFTIYHSNVFCDRKFIVGTNSIPHSVKV